MKMDGWKTYTIAALGVIVNGLVVSGYIDENSIETINYILGFLGVATLRSAVKKVEK
jgi:hypothetical protein